MRLRKVAYFLHRQLAEVLTKRRRRRITWEGFFFLLTAMGIGFAAINTGANLLYLLLSMMLALLIISGIYSSLNISYLKVKRFLPRHISALERVLISLEIENQKRRFPSFSLKAFDYLEGGEVVGLGFVLMLAKSSTCMLNYECLFERRGLYRFKDIRVGSRFPFGFFDRGIIVEQPQELIVYPPTVAIGQLVKLERLELGEYETRKKGMGSSLYALREYVPGDSARLIHWRISARARKLIVREMEKEERKKVSLLLLNRTKGSEPTELIKEEFEKAVILVASMAKYLIENEYMLQLITLQGRVNFGEGQSHLYRILRALAVLELLEGEPAASVSLAHSVETTNIYFQFLSPDPWVHRLSGVEVVNTREIELPRLTAGAGKLRR